MHATELRVYRGPREESDDQSGSRMQHKVTLPLGEVLPLLSDAMRSQRAWVNDFDDDDVTISMDLYEVLLAYQHYRRPSA